MRPFSSKVAATGSFTMGSCATSSNRKPSAVSKVSRASAGAVGGTFSRYSLRAASSREMSTIRLYRSSGVSSGPGPQDAGSAKHKTGRIRRNRDPLFLFMCAIILDRGPN